MSPPALVQPIAQAPVQLLLELDDGCSGICRRELEDELEQASSGWVSVIVLRLVLLQHDPLDAHFAQGVDEALVHDSVVLLGAVVDEVACGCMRSHLLLGDVRWPVEEVHRYCWRSGGRICLHRDDGEHWSPVLLPGFDLEAPHHGEHVLGRAVVLALLGIVQALRAFVVHRHACLA